MLATSNAYKETQLILQMTILSVAKGYIQQPNKQLLQITLSESKYISESNLFKPHTSNPYFRFQRTGI